MKIYVACLASYNNGKLHGEWIDCTLGSDHIKDEIKKMLASSPENNKPYPCEEWAIHDFEGFTHLDEYEDIQKVCELAEFIEEHDDLGRELLSHFGNDLDNAKEAIEDRYQGEFECEKDFAISYAEATMEIPDNLIYYIDYDLMATDLFINDFYSIEVGYKTHVFSYR